VPKGHVAHYKGTLHAARHTAGMINHLVDGDGQCGHVASHHVAGAVAHKNNVDASLVNNLCHRIIIGGQHSNLLPLLFHFYKTVSRHLARIAY